MRAANRKSGFIDPSSTGITNSPHKSLQASINRSLGKELASQLAENEEESESEEEASEGEGEDEIIVTTERRIVSTVCLFYTQRCAHVTLASTEEAKQEERPSLGTCRSPRRNHRHRFRCRHPDR